jgi:hypothetical protein
MKKTLTSLPAAWRLYPAVLVARKPALLREGQQVPRLEAAWEPVRIDAAHLAAYRAVCGCARSDYLPIAYPHILASPLHVMVLSSDRFPVRLMGLVHIGNRIRQQRPIAVDESGELCTWIEGHREGAKGQEFELQTEWRCGGELIWSETSRFLARRRAARGAGEKRPAREALGCAASAGKPRRTVSFHAPVGLGRRYGRIAGDLNPIHMADLTARAFGFKAAIAHGMWSLARCAAEFHTEASNEPCELDVSFKLPVFMPSWVMLESWETPAGLAFELRDSQGEKPHLTGSFSRHG